MAGTNHVHQYWFSNPYSWLKLLIQNKGVHRRYTGKAIVITLISLISYPIQLLNDLLIGLRARSLDKTEDPVFIIGHWRGGTTFLHYILAKDDRFGYITYYHAFVPNLAIIGGSFIKRILGRLTPGKRPQDNINIAMDLPTEEENPLATFSTYSASHSFFFPHNEDYFRKYVLFENTTKTQKQKWQKAYRQILKRISVHQKGKQLLIKNPHNTGRIKELLEIYPNAKFIHIYRNPYEIYPSTYLMYDLVIKTQFLQKFSKENIENKIIYYYTTIMKRFYKEKSIIPEGQLIEIPFEAFEKNPLTFINNIYENLNIQKSETALSKMKSYIEKEKGYVKNKHEIPVHIKNRIEKEWAFSFEELGYKIND